MTKNTLQGFNNTNLAHHLVNISVGDFFCQVEGERYAPSLLPVPSLGHPVTPAAGGCSLGWATRSDENSACPCLPHGLPAGDGIWKERWERREWSWHLQVGGPLGEEIERSHCAFDENSSFQLKSLGSALIEWLRVLSSQSGGSMSNGGSSVMALMGQVRPSAGAITQCSSVACARQKCSARRTCWASCLIARLLSPWKSQSF